MKKKITIIATDRIGCEETISLILDENSKTFKKLKKASEGGGLNCYLSDMEVETRHAKFGGFPYFSQSQLRRLEDFRRLIYNKFYNYELSLQIK